MAKNGFIEFGNWESAKRFYSAATKSQIETAKKRALQKIAVYAEAKAVEYMRSKQGEWAALNPKYLAKKIADGLSDKKLFRTSSYFEAITSFVQGNIVFAGVRKGEVNEKGELLTNLAAVHEYGSSVANIPARPFWADVVKDTLKWIDDKDLFKTELLKELAKHRRQ
jgi:hypothetical protein